MSFLKSNHLPAMMLVTKFFLPLVFLLFLASCAALRCRTEDGPSVEEVKKVVRTCMSNHEEYGGGRNRNKNNDDYDDSDESDSDDDSQEDRNSDHNQNQYYGNQGNQHQQRGDSRRKEGNSHDRKNSNNNNNDNRNQQRHLFAERANRLGLTVAAHNAGQIPDYSGGNSWSHQNGGRDEGNNGNKSRDIDNRNFTSKNNQKENESCMVLCFFKEMKMTNREGFPDRHKMLHIMTHELRDMQLKDFYTDTIQECHHILEMEQARDKCSFARHLVTCLSERAQTNCEDFQDSFIF